jgi:8-oxo-dGTP diphosphatase
MDQPGVWEFPGGKVENDETPEDCLHREILEELKIQINLVIRMTAAEFSFRPENTIRLMPYLCTWSSGDLELTEHDEYRWLSKDSLKTLVWSPADLPIIEELVRFWDPILKIIRKESQS